MTTFADAVAILVIILGCSYLLTKIVALLYGFVRFFVIRAVQYQERRRVERALRQRVRDHINRRRSMHVVGK